MKLEDFLAKMYDRTQRPHATTAHRKVLRFVNLSATTSYRYPLKWLGDGDTFVAGRHAIWQDAPGKASYFWAQDWPTHIAVGASAGAVSGTALYDEMERVPITNWFDEGSDEQVVEFSGPFKPGLGTGTWWEIGLFTGAAVEVVLNSCNTLTNWHSGGALSLDTVEARYGSACLRFQGTSYQPFYNHNGMTVPSGFTLSDRLQLWYYIDDPTKLTTGIRIYLSSSPTDYLKDYYQYSVPKASLSSGWNWISLPLSGYSSTHGNPGVNTTMSFGLDALTGSQTTVQRLDKVRLFQRSGTMWVREALGTAVEKTFSEVRWVYGKVTF